MKQTALHPEHLKLGAKMTEFHGWEMPVYYTSILEEHASVRAAVGLFDISHMGQVWVSGASALDTVNALVVSDVANVGQGRACYTMLVNERGGILDDVIVYRLGPQEFLVIINCANRDKDVAWLRSHAKSGTDVRDISQGRSILAIQGPACVALLEAVLETKVGGLGRFDIAPVRERGSQAWVARTGYTGNDGFEAFVADAQAVRLWEKLLDKGRALGARPVGLGARDTLRLEAGLRLYGTDMDETTTPYEAGLGWAVAIHKSSFLGKDVLAQQKANGVARSLIGFGMSQGPVPRHGCGLFAEGRQVGAVTSGTFSPTLNQPIGMGYVASALAKPGTGLEVDIRLKRHPATVVKMPFWRPGSGEVTQWLSGQEKLRHFATQPPGH